MKKNSNPSPSSGLRVNLAMAVNHQPLVIRLVNQNFLKRLSHQTLHQVPVLGSRFKAQVTQP